MGELEEAARALPVRAGRSGSAASRSSGPGTPPANRIRRRRRGQAPPARRGPAPASAGAPAPAPPGRPAPRGGRPRPRTPWEARCAHPRAGPGRGAGSGPRRRFAAPRRRSACARPPAGRAAPARRRPGAPSSAPPRWRDSGVTATLRTCSSGFRVISWMESTAPSVETQRRGSRRRVSALRAYSIEEIGATSISPVSRRAFSSVGRRAPARRPGPPGRRRPAPCWRRRCGPGGASRERPDRRCTGCPAGPARDPPP